jgi:type II secretory pathway pseudopilin PulG
MAADRGCRGRAGGFTLIEVLIAATILFMVLAVAAESYRGALLASRRATLLVGVLTPLTLVTNAVRDKLREAARDKLDGGGELLGVGYRFEATTVRYGAPARRFDPDDGSFRDYPPRFRLYDVRLTLRKGDLHREFLYQELAWEPFVK